MDGNLYGADGSCSWCWIQNTNTTGKVGSGAGGIGLTQLSEQVLRFVCFYGWLWLVDVPAYGGVAQVAGGLWRAADGKVWQSPYTNRDL